MFPEGQPKQASSAILPLDRRCPGKRAFFLARQVNERARASCFQGRLATTGAPGLQSLYQQESDRPMTETNQSQALPVEELRQRLLDEQQRLEHELYELTSGDEAVSTTDPILESGGMSSDQADDADALSQAERNRAITTHTQQLLNQVNEALARMDAGTYGRCTNCGRPIPLARLKALPYATLCIDCQTKLETAHNPGGRSRV